MGIDHNVSAQPTLIQRLIDEDILLINDGYRAKNSELSDSGLPFARISNINNGFLFDDTDRFPVENLQRVGLKVSKPGDVVFTSKGTVGRFALVRDTTPQFVYSPQICFWRSLDHSKIDPRWLYYWMQSREFFSQYRGVAAQSDMADYVSLRDQRKMWIAIPPLGRQESIAHILGTLDDRIELNRRMNQTLEAIAQAIFKSWFVDFDPVKAKQAAIAAGRDPERAAMAALSGKLRIPKNPSDLSAEALIKAEAQLDRLSEDQRRQLAQTAALFPDTLVDSELGLIPEGWQAEEIGQHLDVVRGLSYKGAGLAEQGIPLHNLNSVFEGGGYKYEGIKFYTLDHKDRHVALPGDVIVANTEQGFDHLLIGYGAIVPKCFVMGLFSHHLYRVCPKLSSFLTNYFILHLFLPGRFWRSVVGFTNGTTVNMLPDDALAKPLVVVPTSELVERFTDTVAPMYDQMESKILESKTLAQLRDTLLPKLLSGELPVAEAYLTAI